MDARAAQARRMVGMLWYNMLSEMSKNGLDSASLGPGGDTYGGMFLWEIAQSDFGKYSGGLVDAVLRQLDHGAAAPALDHPLLPLALGHGAPGTATATSAQEDGLKIAPPDIETIRSAEDLTRAAWPAIKIAASLLDVPAIGVLAQTALETGWGSASPGNNLFGIKSDGSEASSLRATHEVVNGVLVPQTAQFRDYANAQGGIADYVRLIRENFPNVLGQKTVEGFAHALQAGGYATDTAYAAKIVSIARSSLMSKMLSAIGENDALMAP
ncbi:glycoside hydrolase family 73 protein [Acidisoma sp. 7E03]